MSSAAPAPATTAETLTTFWKAQAASAREWFTRILDTPRVNADGTILYLEAKDADGNALPATYRNMVATYLNLPVLPDEALETLWGFPSRGALADVDAYTEAETWYPETPGKRGRLVSIDSLSRDSKDARKMSGPVFTDGKTRIVLSVRIGADHLFAADGLTEDAAKDAEYAARDAKIGTRFLAHFILAALGAPPARSNGAAASIWTGKRDNDLTYASASDKLGFDSEAKTADDSPDRYRLKLDSADAFARFMAQVGHFPEGSLSAAMLEADESRNPMLRVVCPFDFDADAGKVKTVPQKEEQTAIMEGRPGKHHVGRMAFRYYLADALGYCGRKDHRDTTTGKKAKGPVALIMLSKPVEGISYAFPTDPADRAALLAAERDREEAHKAELAGTGKAQALPVVLAATGTDGKPKRTRSRKTTAATVIPATGQPAESEPKE